MDPIKHSVRFKAPTVVNSPLCSPTNSHDLDNEPLSGVGYVESKYQSLTEKGIRMLCSELLELKRASAEEMRKNVCANYTAFIRTSQEFGELELELSTIQTLINTHAVLVRDLLEGVHLESTRSVICMTESSNLLKEESGENEKEIENRFHSVLDAFDVCLAECRVDDAASTLREAELMVSKAQSMKVEPATIAQIISSCSEKKARLVAYIVNTIWELSVHGHELRKLVSLLHNLGEGSQAHTLLLKSYHSRLENGVKNLRPTCSWYTGAYVTNLAQLYFSLILQASCSSLKIFGNALAFASELILWACKETEDYVSLVKKHILSLSVAACGIRAAVDSIQISLGYCALLEKQGFSLGPIILKSLKPCVEGVLENCLRRIEERITVYCAADTWVLTEEVLLSVSRGQRKGHLSTSVKLSTSAHKFFSMVQGLLGDATFIFSTQFGKALLEGVLDVFCFYIKVLIKALPHVNEGEDAVYMHDGMKLVLAESEAQQLAVLGNAAALADEFLPLSVLNWQESVFVEAYNHGQERPVSSGSQSLEQKDWRKRLQRAVDELRDTICEQHILDLLFDNDEKPLLTADLYLCMHDEAAVLENLAPSAPFQALLKKFHGLEQRAREVLAGRERVIVMLFMRLTEAFVMWLSKDEYFWGSIEDAFKLLSLQGLQQFVFDMQFVIQIASAGRYASRKMHHTVAAIVSRAENAFLACDGGSRSVLQADEWFEGQAKRALQTSLFEIEKSAGDRQEEFLEWGSPDEENNINVEVFTL